MRTLRMALLWALLISLLPLCAWAGAEQKEDEMTIPELTIPELTMKQFELPDNEATRLARSMKLGWNLGNTFDAYDDEGWFKGKGDAMETAWVGVRTSRDLIRALKAAGFNTVRIPVSWHNHLEADGTINGAWLARVRQVADWVMAEGMYAIVNVHHDNSLKFMYPDEAHYDQSVAYLTNVWTQIAACFADCDEHLILESLNEPRLVGTAEEWWYNPNSEKCREAAEVINRLNQLFVDIVRASGSNNADRFLLVPGYDASPESVLDKAFRLPEDPAEHRLMIACHAYRPYEFALHKENQKDTTFTLSEKAKTTEIAKFLTNLYDRYVSQGIPVIMDEFGALDKGGNTQDRVNFAAWYVLCASARGITCVWWDNHVFTGGGERFGLIKRETCEWVYPEIVEAMTTYCLYGRE